MSHTGRLNETRNDLDLVAWDFTAFVYQPRPHFKPKRTSDCRDFKAMDQSVMDMIVIIKRMDLRLICQPSERR